MTRTLPQLLSTAIGAAVIASGLAVVTLPAAEAARVKAPRVQRNDPVPHAEVELTPTRSVKRGPAGPVEGVRWPEAVEGTMEVAAPGSPGAGKAAKVVRVGQTPVLLGRADSQAGPGGFRAEVAAPTTAARAGLTGVVFSVSRVADAASEGMTVGLDYGSFENAAGAGFGKRLSLVALPECVLATPHLPRCQEQQPLRSVNDAEAKTVTATAPAGATTFAAVATASGTNGSFAATPLAPSGTWSTSGGSGAFSWSYDVPMPPAAAGPTPSVALSYNSATVDGRNSETNNQSSSFGEGWAYEPGYIERTYRPCSTDTSLPEGDRTGDLCWEGELITLVMGGKATQLVHDDATGAWHPVDDDGERVQKLSGAANGARNGEYWRITATDGTRYHFGLNLLPGATAASATESVLNVPVVGAHPGDPCYDASGFGASRCRQAWRWNLDYVEDTHANAVAYYYNVEENHYGANNNTTPYNYARASYLKRIEYGLRNVGGSIYSAAAGQRVLFDTAERCMPDSTFDCDPSKFTAANASHWPDTPQDQACGPTASCENHSPTFWSRKRTTAIHTQVASAGGYRTVDSVALAQSFPGMGDPELQLDSLTRTGFAPDGTTLTLPPVTFVSQLKANRVDGASDGLPQMLFARLTQITTETGQIISVLYNDEAGQAGRAKPLCTAATLPTDPAQNTSECFPVYWTPPGHEDPKLDYFHKYVVTEVGLIDRNGVSPGRITTFTYVGDPAWHFDDNEVVKPRHRTYGQFRGYGKVDVRTGNPQATSNGVPDKWTLTRTTYLRGMNGDRLPGGASRSVSVADSQGTAYADDNPFADTVLEVQTFIGDTTARLGSTITQPAVIATTAVRSRPQMPDQRATVVRTVTSRGITNLVSGGTAATTSTTTYDSLGRPIQTSETGTGTVAARCTRTSYAENTTTGVRELPAQVSRAAGSCPAPGVALSSVMAETRYYYDNSATLGAVPSAGDLTETHTATAVVGGTTRYARTTFDSDPLGRRVSTTAYASASDAVGRTTTVQYTPAGAGPVTAVTTTNPANQQSSSAFDPGRGVPTRVVDISAAVTDATYDPLGRLTAVWSPGQAKGVDPASVTYAYKVGPTAPLAVTTKTLVDAGTTVGYRTSISVYDAFGALRQTQSDGMTGGRVVADSYTDSHGWVVRTNNRWYTTGAPSTTLIGTTDSAIDSRTQITYDGAGRVVQSTEYKGTTAGAVTKTVYGGDRVTVVPPTGGVTTTNLYDARGQRIELDRYTTPPAILGNVVGGGSYQRTTYRFDALGRQDSMTNSAGTALAATWTSTYDLAGRVIAKTDPDAGTTTSTYNDLGELVTSTDASGATLTYEYDALGRKTSLYHGAATATNRRASWLYDTLQPGKLTSSTRYGADGTTALVTVSTTGYDAVGNPLGTSTRVAEPGFLSDYTTTYTWTKTRLMRSQRLPSSVTPKGGVAAETINYAYNAAGAPISSTGNNAYVSATNYSPYGEVNQYTLGVNTLTAWLTYNRDPQTRRITGVNLSGQTAPPQFEDVAYTYDLYGNVTKTVDTQGAATGAPVQTQCFRYDKLNQLTQAWSSTDSCATDPTTLGNTTKVGGPQPYWMTWSFNAAGVRTAQVQNAVPGGATSKTTTTYTMASPGHAHALSSTSTQVGTAAPTTATYQYDANGNVTDRNGQTITYTPERSVASITAAGTTVSYLYDADGNQVLRRDGGVKTLYLPGQEVAYTTATATTKVTKYYSHNGTVVAMRTNFTNPVYLMADLNGSHQVALSPATWTVARRYLDPYGNQLGATTGTWPSEHGFLDKPKSPITGLSDLGARKYDPTIGRFLALDPLLLVDSPVDLNGYNYASNNPINRLDPSGLGPVEHEGEQWKKPGRPDKLIEPEGAQWEEAPSWQDLAVMSQWDAIHEAEEAAKRRTGKDIARAWKNLGKGIADIYVMDLLDACGRSFSLTGCPLEAGASMLGPLKGPGKLAVRSLDDVPASAVDDMVEGAAKGADEAFSAGKYLNDTWYKSTFPNRTQSVQYHLAKHGKGRTAVEYTQDAMGFFAQNRSLGQSVILRDGTAGIKISTKQPLPGGGTQKVGGYWTNDGRLVTYWD